jgi:hypothetical protein
LVYARFMHGLRKAYAWFTKQQKVYAMIMHIYAEFTHSYAGLGMFMQGLRMSYACLRMVYAMFGFVYAWFTQSLRMVYVRFTQGLRKVCAISMVAIGWVTQGLRRFTQKSRYVYAGLRRVYAELTQSLRRVYVEGISTTNVRKPA